MLAAALSRCAIAASGSAVLGASAAPRAGGCCVKRNDESGEVAATDGIRGNAPAILAAELLDESMHAHETGSANQRTEAREAIQARISADAGMASDEDLHGPRPDVSDDEDEASSATAARQVTHWTYSTWKFAGDWTAG